MAETYYVWSRIVSEVDQAGRATKATELGEKVTKADYPDDWDYFVSTGVVRTTPYPDMGNFDGSPNDYYRSLIQRAMDPQVELRTDQLSSKEVTSLKDAGLIPAGAEEPSTKK